MESTRQLAIFFGFKSDQITPFDFIKLTRKGITASLLKKLINRVHINQEDFANYSGIKNRTLSRRFEETGEKLTPEETEKAIRLARIFFESVDVFGDEEKASTWLKRSNRALNDEVPLSLLDSDIGAEQVMDVLGRIREGVYS
jgi:putative toxin-antitoxin system antitoxin component (TIGR02293 family)